MRIINKKYLLIILLIGVILTGVIVLKQNNKKVQLDNVILKQEVNSKTFAMYTETDNGYEEYEGNKFPEGYALNVMESNCIDNNGNELENVLSYENGNVTITSGNTTYCYLYFDKTLGVEIKEKEPKGLSVDKIRGEMYRFQGQQSDGVDNYICFGTSDKATCKGDADKYMYRIIGIEASTGRVKVIKKEALNKTYQWNTKYDINIEFPQSIIYNAINGTDFLKNTEYVPEDWEEKISDNTWRYGDMLSNNTLGASQVGEELYLVETGQNGTVWDIKVEEETLGAKSAEVTDNRSKYVGTVFYYMRHENEKWTNSFNGKVSLMYIHDYYYSVNDTANCQYAVHNYDICKNGWMHLSQNDIEDTKAAEWTMTRYGWNIETGWYDVLAVMDTGGLSHAFETHLAYTRPVFYIKASEELLNGKGTITDPFIIAN